MFENNDIHGVWEVLVAASIVVFFVGVAYERLVRVVPTWLPKLVGLAAAVLAVSSLIALLANF